MLSSLLAFALLNVLMVYVFEPSYGEHIYGAKTVLWQGYGRFYLTSQELFYLFNLALKYFCTVPLAVLFLMTTHLVNLLQVLIKLVCLTRLLMR